MSISHELIKNVSAILYEKSLKITPERTVKAIDKALETETNPIARDTLKLMKESSDLARENDFLLCSDSGIPVYYVNVGTKIILDADPKEAIKQGFAEVVANAEPPILPHITNPLTLERSHSGIGMPIVNYDLLPGEDYLEIVCHPKGLGSGQMAELKVFSFPSNDQIKEYVLSCVQRAGSKHCPPVVIGVGIGGTIDVAAKLSKKAMLRPLDQPHELPEVAKMERELLEAVNATGIGPMGTGGDTTAWVVHVEISASHGFVPIAVCYDCWMARIKKAKIYDDGKVEYFE